jgi:hypothetical protein
MDERPCLNDLEKEAHIIAVQDLVKIYGPEGECLGLISWGKKRRCPDLIHWLEIRWGRSASGQLVSC